MKVCLCLIFALLACTAVAQVNTSDPEARNRELFQTYGYCLGQQRSLDQIRRDFPSLGVSLYQAEAAFSVTFGKSCTAIGEQFSDAVRQRLKDEFDKKLPATSITESVARDFIARVSSRAKGDIDTPVKETLLSFNPDFRKSPGLEFMRGFTRTYSTANHPKAKGLNLEIKVPMSWMAREGNRPNVVQFFKAEYGRSDVAALIMVQQFTPPKGVRVTQRDIDELFSARNLKDFVPDGAKILESKPITLEGSNGGMWVLEERGERLDFSMTMRTLQYAILYNNRLIFLKFAAGGTEDTRAEWVATFERSRPLFQMVANSLVIVDKYRN